MEVIDPLASANAVMEPETQPAATNDMEPSGATDASGSLAMTVEEAQEHIAKIRFEKEVDTIAKGAQPGVNIQDLRAALNVLSDQLYTTPTHFLHELIQNADDNSYASGVLPSVSFHSTPGALHIKCNESGFEAKHVDSICRISNSTKKDRSKGFIGEKGIGFKSVFKVANVVFISSRAYSFKFDRDGPLGMIAPVWSAFPVAVQKEFTQFYLQLSSDRLEVNEKAIRIQLKKFDSTLLLFLRNLKRISVSIDDGSQTVEGKFTKQIFRDDTESHGGEMVRIHGDRQRLRKNVEDTDYLVVRHEATKMPIEAKRLGLSTSQVVLAFPWKNEPTFFRQMSYAFLPIRESSFRFLIHADFILVANREDIEASNDWNEHLLLALVDCFSKAVERFNSPGAEKLKYSWLGYLQEMPRSGSNSFAPLSEVIVDRLKDLRILETQEGELVRPCDGIFVPPVFRNDGGKFILAKDAEAKAYISSDYEEHDPAYVVLKLLGVEILSPGRFLELLKSFIAENFEAYTNKSSHWHGQLARVLFNNLSNSRLDVSDLKALPIFQLQDDSWVRQVDAQCHFEAEDAKVLGRLPAGISDLHLIHINASQDQGRKKLLEKLGAKVLNATEVCRLLCNFHELAVVPDLDFEALLYHATYLFEVNSQRPKKFIVHDIDNTPRLASTMYLNAIEQDRPKISELLPREQWGSRLLHPRYLLEFKGKHLVKWTKWLESSLGMRSTIRIVDVESKLTSEFRHVAANADTQQMLEVLMVSWLRESTLFNSTSVRQMIGAIEVTCEDGSKVRLHQTCLNTLPLRKFGVPGIHFLKLGPQAQKLKKLPEMLSEFGVVVKPNLDFYLRCLTLTIGKPVEFQLKAQLLALYGNIHATFLENPDLVKDYFKSNSAIYIPRLSIWVPQTDTVVWDPTPGVAGEFALSPFYPELQSFFFHHLGIHTATIDIVIAQLDHMSRRLGPVEADDLITRKKLIYSICDFLRKPNAKFNKLRELQDLKVMPLAGRLGLMSTQLARLNENSWFFRDRHDLHDAFKEVKGVDFADFKVEEYPRLEILDIAISKAWDVNEHRMSKNVTETSDTGIQGVFDLNLTAFLRSKLRSLRRVIRHACGSNNSTTKANLDSLHYLKVMHAPNMTFKPLLSQGQIGKSFEGLPRTPQALHKRIVGGVEFYVRSREPSPSPAIRTALAEELDWFCGIGQDRMQWLVLLIMLEDDERMAYDMLTKHGVDGHEEQSYQPLPVQPTTLVPAPVLSVPASASSTNNRDTVNPTTTTTSIPVPAPSSIRVPLAPLVNGTRGSLTDQKLELTSVNTSVDGTRMSTVNHKAELASMALSVNGTRISTVDLKPQAIPELISVPPSTSRAPARNTRQNVERKEVYGFSAGASTFYEGEARTRKPKEAAADAIRPSSSGSSSASGRAQPLHKRISPKVPGAVMSSSGHSTRLPTLKYEADQLREQAIGLAGEKYVYTMLQSIFAEYVIGEECWTSELRATAGHEFTRWKPADPTANYADFTIIDTDDILASWLATEHEVFIPDTPGERVFHIEVKSTTSGSVLEPFHMSPAQMSMCMEYSLAEGSSDNHQPQNVFLLFRVAGVESAKPELKVFADLAALFEARALTAVVENWVVFASEVSEESLGNRDGESNGAV